MRTEEAKIITNLGSVICEGKEFFLQQEAYLDQDFNFSGAKYYYTALGRTLDNTKCNLRWEIINSECEDEGEACDWDEYEITSIWQE
jgi:hypothetical protein